MKDILYLKSYLILFMVLSMLSQVQAQLLFRVSGGTNLTPLPNYMGEVNLAADGLIVPGLIVPANSRTPLHHYQVEMDPQPQEGWNANVSLGITLYKQLTLNFGLGLLHMRYDVHALVDTGGPVPVNLNEYDSRFGRTALTYLQVEPASVRLALFRRQLVMESGLMADFLLSKKQNDVLVLYEEGNSGGDQTVDQVYFTYHGSFSPVLAGGYFRLGWAVIEQLEVTAGMQYYFNPIFDDDTRQPSGDKVYPFVLQLGATFRWSH